MKKSEPWDGFLPPSTASRVQIDAAAFRGKRVLITGGGGSIGSALARVLAGCCPHRLVLLDHAEEGLYQVEQDLEETGRRREIELVVGSACDPSLVGEVLHEYRPQLIFHAAALKHVPLMEGNLPAAIETNVLGMGIVAEASAAHGVEKLVLLSTDKAVDPISVMGLSKRLAELIVLGNGSSTSMTAVRLCNILGSSGSVAPHFVQQIKRGEAVTVTHAAASRFFLSIDEAVRLLLLAATRTARAELLIPHLDSPQRILDLAEFLIGRIGQGRSRLMLTQLRPGDKLHEQMSSKRERVEAGGPGEQPLLRVESPALPAAQLEALLLELRSAMRKRDRAALLAAAGRAVPEYQPAMETTSR